MLTHLWRVDTCISIPLFAKGHVQATWCPIYFIIIQILLKEVYDDESIHQMNASFMISLMSYYVNETIMCLMQTGRPWSDTA